MLFKTTRLNYSEAIKRDLLDGITVVVDRYVYSGIAFSTAKVHDTQYLVDFRDWIIHGVGTPRLIFHDLMLCYFYLCQVTQQRPAMVMVKSGMKKKRCSVV